MDPNLPSHWQVVHVGTSRVVANNLTHDQALAHCQDLEPHPETTGFRYVMQPVRACSSLAEQK